MSELYDLKPGSKEHEKMLTRVKARFDLADRARSQYRHKWDEVEEEFIAYMPLDDAEEMRKQRYRQDGEPSYYNIKVPYHYAITMTAHTYWASVFLSRDPIFQYAARHGETARQTEAVETLVDYQINVGENIGPLFLWLLDKAKYGEGILGCYWADEFSYISSIERVPEEVNGIPIEGRTKKKRVTQRARTYSGNRLFNVKPHDFFPDPRVPLTRFQDGEFCARQTTTGWNNILRGKAEDEYHKEAVERLRKIRRSQAQTEQGHRGSPQVDRPETNDWKIIDDTDDVGFVNLIEMYIELVPKEWGLGSSPYPEKWMFVMAEKKVIIAARPLGYHHNKFPFLVDEYEMDAYSARKRGMIELTQSLNDVMTWLFNSHFHNVRTTLNNQLIVDPSRVVMKDLQTGKPGFLARLKPAAYGTDVRSVVHQLQVGDVTSQHLGQADQIGQLMQRLTGVTDNVMGMVNTGGRKSATEVRTSSSFSVTRLKTSAEYSSAQAWSPLARMMLQNTQQFYDEEAVFRVAGRQQQGQSPQMEIGPEQIMGFYDFVAVDGTLPVDRFAQASLWRELFETLMSAEGLAQEFDLVSIFMYIAQLSGAKNVDQFRLETADAGDLQEQARRGDIVPMRGDSGDRGTDEALRPAGSRVRPSGRAGDREGEGSRGSTPGASQVSGVGPTG